MRKLIWSEQARAAWTALPEPARAELDRRLDYVREMPRLYPAVPDERFPGCRGFWLEPTYRVFYMVGAGSEDVFVTAIVAEEVSLLEE